MAGPYSKAATAMVNGVAMLEISEIEFDATSNDKPVYTLAQGRSGDSDGAEEVAFSWSSAVPARGREFDYVKACLKHNDVTMAFRMGGATRTAIGRISTAKEKSSVNSPNDLSGQFSGRYIDT
jgi:hypothetical protein